MTDLVLASASPARLATLRAAGVEPQVIVSAVDEDAVIAALGHVPSPAEHAQLLAEAKCLAVVERVRTDGREDGVVLGCDSVLEIDGVAHGKPSSAADAVARWRRMRGRSGVLHSGHHLVHLGTGEQAGRTASTVVHFGDPSDAEIEAYVATGEPLHVAGAFTVDGLGGPFVDGVEGDIHAVVGVSLPLLRRLLVELGVGWFDLPRRA